jgi:dTDP-4-amino-4,6-dideoxygalactose transaminase
MIYYPVPLHMQKVHAYLGLGKGHLPVTEEKTTKVMSLPMFPELTFDQQKQIAETLKKALASL